MNRRDLDAIFDVDEYAPCCEECWAKMVLTKEYCGEYFGVPSYEDVWVCPCCDMNQ